MQRRRRRSVVAVLRRLLTCAICALGLAAFFNLHLGAPKLPDSFKLPMDHELSLRKFSKQNIRQEMVHQHARSTRELVGAGGNREDDKLWKHPSNRDFVPCVEPSSNYAAPEESKGYLLVNTNGGLNQMRAGICDMVAVARIIGATLVIPELDKRSFWQDSSNFADVFDEDHFISALANDVKVVKKLPKKLLSAPKSVMQFRSWSGLDYYQKEISTIWPRRQVIRAVKSDSRLANNNLPPDIQKLRCRACYEALRFSPKIEAMGKLLVDRMRSHGRYIALHLRYEKDMLAFSGCTHALSPEEAYELTRIRENTPYWKVKDINSTEQRAKGFCPLTPKEVGILLSALGYPSETPIYIAAGEIYGGEARMADLQSRYPILMSKEKLASTEELQPFIKHASQMAALDYIVSVESDVFVPSYSGNMARAVEGHRRYLGHRKTIIPDRKALTRLVDKLDRGAIGEGRKLSDQIIEIHKRSCKKSAHRIQLLRVFRQHLSSRVSHRSQPPRLLGLGIGSARKRKGPISGTRGMDRFRSEEVFYENPLPDCLCRGGMG